MPAIRAYATNGAKQPLVPFNYDPGPLGADDVEVAVEYCGICHSDLSMIRDEWGLAKFPLVPGHEVIGRVAAIGAHAKGLTVGQRVGVGWTAESCMHCRQCLGGDEHLCPEARPTMIGRHGGFADRVRAHAQWVIPIPDGVDPTSAGPLLCGGITVFAPLYTFDIKPPARVGVIGIGGLGHMALRFARAWGCDVTAFTSSASKYDEARSLGAHHVASSTDSAAIGALSRTFDLLLVTANVPLDWGALISSLAPKGRMHVVGAVTEPIPVSAFSLISAQRSVSGSPTGAPITIATMLDFAARHKIAPQVEHYPMSKVNDAMARLESGKARYRVVLDADFR